LGRGGGEKKGKERYGGPNIAKNSGFQITLGQLYHTSRRLKWANYITHMEETRTHKVLGMKTFPTQPSGTVTLMMERWQNINCNFA
jgi:hypothetical protein